MPVNTLVYFYMTTGNFLGINRTYTLDKRNKTQASYTGRLHKQVTQASYTSKLHKQVTQASCCK